MRNRVAVFLILAGIVSGLIGTWLRFGRHERLNVILITLDTTRADRLETYGYEQGLTEEFGAYSQQGVVFDRAYAPAPITLPSHATMLTGLYPPEHGLRVNGQGKLAKQIALLPEILHDQGYQTAAFVSAAVLDSTFGLDRGFDLYEDFASQRKTKKLSRQRRPGQDVVDSALNWLTSQTDKPFFCWIHLFDAHAPYEPRPEIFGSKFEKKPYDAGIAFELQQVERVTRMLQERHGQSNTLVIIAADHGEGLGDHRESEHGMLAYNSTLHVPLIFVGTKYCRPGTRVATAVSLADITPTVLDLLNLRQPSHVSGRSLKAALSGRAIPARPCYAEAEGPLVFNRWSPLHVLISDDWKYIQTKLPELYSLKDDPLEQRNLIDSSGDLGKELQSRLEELEQSFETFKPQNASLTDKQISDLTTLGYTGVAKSTDAASPVDITKLADVKEMMPLMEKFDEAKRLSLQGNLDAAIGLTREIQQSAGQAEYLEATYLLGDCLIAAKRPEEAIEVFLQVLEKHPDIEQTHFRLATALLQQGNFEQAEKEFRRTVEHEPGSAIAHCELARVLVRLAKTEDAVVEYRQALKIEPDNPTTNSELGQLLLKLGRPREAVSCFENALKINPGDGVVQMALLGVFVQLGDFPRAIELARSSVKIAPQSFEARFNFGVLLVSLNQYQEGLNELREAQKLRPEEPRVLEFIKRAEAARKQLKN